MKKYHSASPCPKCGCKDVASAYTEAYDRHPYGFFKPRYKDDTITRLCTRCHFDWSELPIDHDDGGSND